MLIFFVLSLQQQLLRLAVLVGNKTSFIHSLAQSLPSKWRRGEFIGQLLYYSNKNQQEKIIRDYLCSSVDKEYSFVGDGKSLYKKTRDASCIPRDGKL